VPCLPVAIIGASEAMPYGQNWPTRGRLPVYVAFGEPMRAEDGETVSQFSDRIAKEVRGLIDYATTYRANQA
jgi:1-acyl-sn-glycerol-3-phosphate acyltransferase